MRRLMISQLSLIVLVCAASAASAQDVWTDPAPGVRHLTRDGRYAYDNNPRYQAHVLLIDLTHPAVSLHATPPDQPGGTVSAFARRNGLPLAWNTNFFSNPQTPCGMMMGGGQLWTNAYVECEHSLGVGANNEVEIFSQRDPLSPPQPWMREIVTGTPAIIVNEGAPTYSYGCGAPCAYNPRVGLGYNRERTTLILVVVDGRSATSVGAGLDDLGNLLVEQGAWTAINLDGGGSAALYVEGEGGVVNRPSDGQEREVCCHMGVRINPDARWYRAERVEQSHAELTLALGASETLWVDYRNTGRRPWSPEGPNPVLLGAFEPQDRTSALAAPTWPQPNRPARVPGLTPPGSIARFTFTAQASSAGDFTEVFAPVAESAAWMGEEPVTFRIHVPGQGADAGPDASSDAGAEEDVAAAGDAAPEPDAPAEDSGRDVEGGDGAPGDAAPDSPNAPSPQRAAVKDACSAAGGAVGATGAPAWLLLVAGALWISRRR